MVLVVAASLAWLHWSIALCSSFGYILIDTSAGREWTTHLGDSVQHLPEKSGTTLAWKFDNCSREIARDTAKVPERAQWLQGRGVVSSLCSGSAGSIPTLQHVQK